MSSDFAIGLREKLNALDLHLPADMEAHVNGDFVEVTHLWVKPFARRDGIASWLLTRAMDEAKQAGATQFAVTIGGGDAAQALLEKLGMDVERDGDYVIGRTML
jgi:Acetyltransferase (GNAT) family.